MAKEVIVEQTKWEAADGSHWDTEAAAIKQDAKIEMERRPIDEKVAKLEAGGKWRMKRWAKSTANAKRKLFPQLFTFEGKHATYSLLANSPEGILELFWAEFEEDRMNVAGTYRYIDQPEREIAKRILETGNKHAAMEMIYSRSGCTYEGFEADTVRVFGTLSDDSESA